MSKARELAELGAAYDSGALSNRNLIINGGMEVAQRGTSSTSSGYVSLDRFYVNQSGASTTFSQETNANPSEIGGLQKYARLNVSSSSDFCHIRQPIEDVTTVPAGTVTLSFYAKGTAPAGGLYTYGNQHFGSGGSSDVDWTAVLITSTLTSDWVRYTAQITVPSLDGKTVGAGSYFLLDIGQHSNSASTAFDLNITGVQLEVGTEATPFEHRSFDQEFILCQRYYQKSYVYGTAIGTATQEGFWSTGGHQGGTSTNYIEGIINFERLMRATPAIVIYDHSGNSGKCARLAAGTARYANENIGTAQLCARGVVLYSASGTAAGIIQAHYTVDAEL